MNDYLPKSYGGLVLKSFRALNKAMETKLVCLMANSKGNLWMEIMRGKYLQNKELASILWESDLKEGSAVWNHMQEGVNTIKCKDLQKIGKDTKQDFCKDKWLTLDPIPRPQSLSFKETKSNLAQRMGIKPQELYVRDANGKIKWRTHLKNKVLNRELESLYKRIGNISISEDEVDQLEWLGDASRTY